MNIVWTVVAEQLLLTLEPSDAEAILVAAEHYAETGRGFARELLDGHGTRGLYVSSYVVLFIVDEPSTIRVLRIRKRPMRPPGS